MESLIHELLLKLKVDPKRPGLERTPTRVSHALKYLTQGYQINPHEILSTALFDNHSEQQMVVVKDIDFFSLCEHHMLPFFGTCHLAYIPNKKIAGLSKIAKVVDAFAKRLQMQERLTHEIAHCFVEILQPKGLGIVMNAKHLCMMMRGAQKERASAVTSLMLGSFRDDESVRQEFFSHIRS